MQQCELCAACQIVLQAGSYVQNYVQEVMCRISFRIMQGSHASWKVLEFFLENSRTWKVLENHFGPGKSWKLKLKVLESPGKISLKVVHFSVSQRKK